MVLFQLNRKIPSSLKTILPVAVAAALVLGNHYRMQQAVAARAQENLHSLHVKDQGLACEDCHIPNLKINQETCPSCHEPGVVDHFVMKFSKQSALPGMVPRPRDHADDWRRAHGPLAELDHRRCSACHTQSFCQDCHEGVNLQGQVHSLNFRNTHRFEAQGAEEECLACHQTRQFCLDCHKTQPFYWNAHPHGPSWANQSEGGAHREEAESNLESCLACHDLGAGEPTCTQPGCHDGGRED